MSRAFASFGPRTATALSAQWIDLRLASAIRLMLATSALLVIAIDPPAGKNPPLFFTALCLYIIYSSAALTLSIHRGDLIPVQLMHWVDMIWYQLLVYLSSGTGYIFFGFFFFSILVGSFSFGYKSGLRITLVSAAIFTLGGILTINRGGSLGLHQLMLRSMELLILGFMIARFGGFRISLRNRLQLLKDVTDLSNGRFGTDRTISSILEKLREFFDADACLLLIRPNSDSGTTNYQMYRIRRGLHSRGCAPPEISAEAAALFLLPSSNYATIYRKPGERPTLIDLNTRQSLRADSVTADRLANALDATSYVSVPLRKRSTAMGRLYIIGGSEHYDNSTVDFVIQLMDHVTPIIENIRLIDSLASYAADEERRRIARDIHDSVIQPYVGLQLGIAAVAQKLRAGNIDVTNNVEELLDLTNQELIELRSYVWGLRAGEKRRDVLLPAIERFVSRFSTVTAIDVSVSAIGKFEINDRLAAEIFQMVTEGLSNIRRHALCKDASVELSCHQGTFLLKIKNPRPSLNGDHGYAPTYNAAEKALFTPKSISERASLLGGKTEVSIDEKNRTVVQVAIPL